MTASTEKPDIASEEMIEATAYIGSHPGFRLTSQELEGASLESALNIASREGLAAKGVRLHQDLRVTLRTFEEQPDWLELKNRIQDGPTAEGIDAVPLRATLCGSIGSGDRVNVCASLGDELPKPPRMRPNPIPPGAPPYEPPRGRPPPGRPKPVSIEDEAAIESDRADIRASLQEINKFVSADPFRSLVDELRLLPSQEERHDFVARVITNEEALGERGINVPANMRVQRSFFADGRPTLFCVSSKLADGLRKVTITFDDAV